MSGRPGGTDRGEQAAAEDRRAAVLKHYAQVCLCEWTDDDLPVRTMASEKCSMHGNAPDPLDALLAERQQDKERIERLETALSVYADPRHWAISRDDLAMRVVSWIDRLLCRVFGHCYDAYRIPIRCMYCGQRWRARGSHD